MVIVHWLQCQRKWFESGLEQMRKIQDGSPKQNQVFSLPLSPCLWDQFVSGRLDVRSKSSGRIISWLGILRQWPVANVKLITVLSICLLWGASLKILSTFASSVTGLSFRWWVHKSALADPIKVSIYLVQKGTEPHLSANIGVFIWAELGPVPWLPYWQASHMIQLSLSWHQVPSTFNCIFWPCLNTGLAEVTFPHP